MEPCCKNHSGSALIVTLLLIGVLSLVMILLMEKIIPTSQAIRGIENSTIWLYHSASAIEKAFASMNYRQPGLAAGTGNITVSSAQEEGKYNVSQSSTIVPIPGKGTSEYDSNWNRINTGNPVQLRISSQSLLTSLEDMVFDLRMPKIGTSDSRAGYTASTRYFTSNATTPVINVILSNSSISLISDYGTSCSTSGAQNNGLTADRVNDPDTIALGKLCMKNTSVIGSSRTLEEMLDLTENTNFCSGWCTLKFSLVNKLENAQNQEVPYLEYRIRKQISLGSTNWENCFLKYPPITTACSVDMNLAGQLGLPITTVDSEWIAYGYRRTNTRDLQQLTTNEAFDFAVFK